MNTFRFEFEDQASSTKAIVAAEKMENNNWAIKYNKPNHLFPLEVWRDLFQSTINQLLHVGFDSIATRVRTDYEHQKFISVLTSLGFKHAETRIEYKALIADLPSEETTPLKWKSFGELTWSKKDLTSFVENVTEATGFLKNETAESFISDWIHHEELTHGPECIHVGFGDNMPISLCVAQVEKSTGWSRIAYMGLIPHYRRKGLGKWVHRHGFAMMKQQGGSEYVGGTSTENDPMIQLFNSHGCKSVWQLEEWTR